MDHAMPARYRLPDETLDLHVIGPVMLFDDLRPGLGRRGAGHRRKKLWVADRAIEIDKQTADSGSQQRPLPPKQMPIGRGYAVTAVFTGDGEAIHRYDSSPLQLGQMAKHLPHTFAPFVAEGGEIGVPLIESPPPLHFEAVAFVANQ